MNMRATSPGMHSAAICCSSILPAVPVVSPGGAMFAFIIMYGACLPEDWLDEEMMSIVSLQGEFTMVAFAEAIAPIARCVPFALPVTAGTQLHSWTWSGYVTWRCCLSCQEQLSYKEVNFRLSDSRTNLKQQYFP